MLSEDPAAPVVVTVTRRGSPAIGRPVYFQGADSSLVAEMMTGVDGKASAVLATGGFVTVIEPEPDPPPPGLDVAVISTHLSTFAEVRSGEQLHLDLGPPAATVTTTFDLTVPDEGLGRKYTLYSSCGQAEIRPDIGTISAAPAPEAAVVATVTGSVTLEGCNGTADMLVVSSESGGESGDRITGALYQPGVAVADAVPVALTGDYMAVNPTSFTYTTVPSGIDQLTVVRELRSVRGRLFITDSSPALVDKTSSTATTTLVVPTPPNVEAVTTAVDQPTTGHGQQTFVEWGAAASGAYTLDYGTVALRRYDTLASFDVATRAIAWTDINSGIEPSFVLGQVHAQRVDPEPAATVHEWVWRIAAPYVTGQPKVAYPRLPTTIYDFNPVEGDQPVVEQLTTLRVPGGYEAARSHAFAVPPVEFLGPNGRIVLEDLFTPVIETIGTGAPPRPTLSHGRFTPRLR
jgi:hypothetical protein